ncbi:MAG TPA: alpha/beta hydrolase, partial [Chitinophagaceae bacterium]|nr:alpha/beta hydrolase [Chitinophagaceae bacterium]
MSITSLLFGTNGKEKETTFLQSRAPVRSVPGYLQPIVQQKICGNHAFLEAGHGKPVIFCHGLFGGIFNIDIVCEKIAENYRFIMPYLPMYDMPLLDCTVKKLGDYLYTFINDLQLKEAVVIGSSMGGGTALYYAGYTGNKLKGMVLCGSSGLSSIPLSKGYFRRKDYSFVKEATKDTFYDRSIPT